MSKVSAPTFVVCGLGDPKVRPIGVADGLQVNIPVLGCIRYHLGKDETGYHVYQFEVDIKAAKQSL